MCNFMSAIITKDKKFLCLPEFTDSHEDLIEFFELDDTKLLDKQEFVRLEFIPSYMDIFDPQKWIFKVDQKDTPKWFNKSMKNFASKCCKNKVKSMFITIDKKILLGGFYILKDCTISRVFGSKIVMYGNSIVKSMYGNSIVESMYSNSIVESMFDNSIVKSMYDNSIVKSMHGNNIVKSMYGNSIVKSMHGNNIVESMFGNSIVKSMYSNSIVKSMLDNSIVKSMFDNSIVESMLGNSIVKSMFGNSKKGEKV